MGQGDINYAILIDSGSDCKRGASRVKLHGQIVSIEAILPFVKSVIGQRVGAPQMLERSGVIEDFRIELTCGADSAVAISLM